MVQHVIIEAVACQDVAAIIGLVERPVVAQPLGTEHQNAVVAQLVVFDDGQGLEGFAETDAIGDYAAADARSEEHTSELQSLMRNSYAVFCLEKKHKDNTTTST